jgi:hypothetical protein
MRRGVPPHRPSLAFRRRPGVAVSPYVPRPAKSLSEAERRFLARSAVRVLQKGGYRLADVASLVLRAAARTPTTPADLVPD